MAIIGEFADIGWGIELDWNGNTYCLIDTVNGPTPEIDSVEKTTSCSEEAWMEFIAGMINPGTLQVTINLDPDNPVEPERTVRSLTLRFPPKTGQTNGATFVSDAHLKSMPTTAPLNGRMTQHVTWQLSGKPNWTDGS